MLGGAAMETVECRSLPAGVFVMSPCQCCASAVPVSVSPHSSSHISQLSTTHIDADESETLSERVSEVLPVQIPVVMPAAHAHGQASPLSQSSHPRPSSAAVSLRARVLTGNRPAGRFHPFLTEPQHAAGPLSGRGRHVLGAAAIWTAFRRPRRAADADALTLLYSTKVQ